MNMNSNRDSFDASSAREGRKESSAPVAAPGAVAHSDQQKELLSGTGAHDLWQSHTFFIAIS